MPCACGRQDGDATVVAYTPEIDTPRKLVEELKKCESKFIWGAVNDGKTEREGSRNY